jgi:hypothetical protein
MPKGKPPPDQLALDLAIELARGDHADDLEHRIEVRAAELAQDQAVRWRFRLVVIETTMLTALVIAAGIALEQPTGMVLRGAAVIGVSCFLTGALLIALTGAANRLLAKVMRRKSRLNPRRIS